MKNKVTINKRNGRIDFYLNMNSGRYYMFTQPFSKGVYDYFLSGRSENEIRKYSCWNNNPRLEKTISKIPMYIEYVRKELIA